VRAAYAAWISVCLIWGTTYLAIRIALDTIPPALVGGLRYTCAGAVLMLVLRAQRIPVSPFRHWGGLAFVGLMMIVIGNGGVIWAEQWVPTGIAAVTVAATPFWMTGLEAALPRGDRLSARALAGLLVGFAGIVLLVWPDLTAGGASGRQFGAGMIALQVACAGWAIGSSYSRRHPEDNAIAAAAVQMLLGGAMMLIIAAVRGEWAQLSFTPRTLAAEAYLTVVGSLVGYPAYVFALKHLRVSLVSMYAYVNPVIAALLGAAVLAEPLGPRVAVATAAVLLGIAMVGRSRPRQDAPGNQPR
jgi:drug/metabolite transporter (DMT)-like permease